MIPKPLHVINEGLAFLLEIIALVVFCWWGFHVGHNLGVHLLLGLGAPILMILVWGRYAAPRATVKLPMAGVLGVKAVVFGAATAAMAATGWPVWAIVFGVVALVNTLVAAYDRDALMNQR